MKKKMKGEEERREKGKRNVFCYKYKGMLVRLCFAHQREILKNKLKKPVTSLE
jgi:hypothetical protein